MTRVLLATRTQGRVGGIESYVHAILPLLEARGFTVGLLFERGVAEGEPRLDSDRGLPTFDVSSLGLQGALAAVRAWRPDVVYQQGLDALPLERALLEAYPNALFAHDYRGTCISGTKRHAFPVPAPCARTLGPGCLVSYLPRRCGGRSPVTAVVAYARERERLELIRRYPRVLVASSAMRAELLRHGLVSEQVVRAPLFAAGNPRATLPPPRSLSGRVLMVGRLTGPKGGLELVRAVARASAQLGRPLSLTVAGDGPERARMEREVRALAVPAAFLGWVDSAERERRMLEADVLAVPSIWPEPFGLVGVEAGALGLPAVAFAVGGITEWCEPGVSGELAPSDPPSIEGLAAALVRAFTSPEHHARLREGAWRKAQALSAAAHADRVAAELEAAAALRVAA